MTRSRPERLVIPDLAIKTSVVRARLDGVRARPGATDDVIRQNVGTMLTAATEAAYGRSPRTRRTRNWWSGTLNDVGYRSLHAASAEVAVLFTRREVRAALPDAVGRIQGSSLSGSDPRRLAAQQALDRPETVDGDYLRQLITIGYEIADEAYARVRGFRNVVLFAAMLVLVVGSVFVGYVIAHPEFIPLCFDAPNGTGTTVVCPTSQTVLAAGAPVPASPETPQDVVLVCLLGLLGATLCAAVSLRNVRGSSDPYSVPLALTALKVPAGALTAILALVAIQAGFVPGLSYLDSQAQIIAYALLFGYAQQVLTGLVDRQGASVLAGVPNRANASPAMTVAAAGLLAPLPSAAAPVPTGPETDAGEPDDEPDESDLDESDLDESDFELSDVELSEVDDSDLPDLYPQDVAGGGIDDDGGTLDDLPDEPDEPDGPDEPEEPDEPEGPQEPNPAPGEDGAIPAKAPPQVTR